MPNATIPYLSSMTPPELEGCAIETQVIDEYVRTDLSYLRQLEKGEGPTLLALAGVQSHQFQRSLDLAAYALEHGVEHCIIGGPHPMTCDTSMLHGRGVSFALAEAETIWTAILQDAIKGELQPVYGEGRRWQQTLEAPVLQPPSRSYLRRYIVPMLGIYPARGCPFTCSFCSVIKIAGRAIRSQDLETTMASLRAAKAGGVKAIMFTSDNFNKYPDGPALLEAMIAEKIRLPFFVQCDTQIAKQEELVDLLARAGCFKCLSEWNPLTGKFCWRRTSRITTQRFTVTSSACVENAGSSHTSRTSSDFPRTQRQASRSIWRHLSRCPRMLASFYILTPIPGTQQYDEFLAAGKIIETNLDRFDGTNPVWRHDQLDWQQLEETLFRCYRRFFSASHLMRFSLGGRKAAMAHGIALHLFSRFAAHFRMHPMSGGVGRVSRDSDSDYLNFRRKRFGFEQVPLPESLRLSAEDTAINSRARVS